jgi:hypothetical protein
MPVDLAKAYFEIRQLRKEVRKAELACRISFAHPSGRALYAGHISAHEPQAASPPMPGAKQQN